MTIFQYIHSVYKKYPKEVWTLTLIVLLFVGRKTVFNVAREVGNYQATLDQGTSLAIIGMVLSVIAISYNTHAFRVMLKKNGSFLSYYMLCWLSFLWAGYFSTIVFKATEVLCCFSVVALIIYKIDSMKGALFYIILLSTVITYIDALNGMFRYGFHFHHTNAYTFSAMIGLLLCLGTIHVSVFTFKELRWFIILETLALIGGTSSASYIACIIGIILLYSSGKHGIRFVQAVCVCVVLYIVYEFAYDIIFNFVFKRKSEESIATGTGRQFIWEAAIRSWKTSPWLGNGFLVGERSLASYGLGLQVVSAHNTFISVLVGTGVIGMCLFVNFLLRWFGRLYLCSKTNRFASMLFPVAIAIMVNCMGFPAIGSDWNYVAPCIYALIVVVFMKIDKHVICE